MLGVIAFTSIPLAEVYALIFLAPLFVTLLSIVVLKEHVGPWRWFAVMAGFVGVLLVVRPGFRELELGHLAALCIALLAAISVILMRSLSAHETRTTMLGFLMLYVLLFNLVGNDGDKLRPADAAPNLDPDGDRRAGGDRQHLPRSGRRVSRRRTSWRRCIIRRSSGRCSSAR